MQQFKARPLGAELLHFAGGLVARARWIKPEFFTDRKICQVSDRAAFVFAAIWVEADDGGVAPGDPQDLFGRRFIKRTRWGWDVVAVESALVELVGAGLLQRIEHRGEPFVLIPEFARKQGIKPKLWRHLGNDHDAIVEAVLSRSNGSGTSENAGGRQPDEVLLPRTPKPLAVAVSQSHKPEPQLKPLRSAAAQEALDEVIRQVPEAYRDAIVGLVRASHDPEAVVMTVRAAGPGGIHESAPWDVVGRAVLELRAAGGGFSPIRFTAFCRKLLEAPPASGGGAEKDHARMTRLGEEELRRERAAKAAP